MEKNLHLVLCFIFNFWSSHRGVDCSSKPLPRSQVKRELLRKIFIFLLSCFFSAPNLTKKNKIFPAKIRKATLYLLKWLCGDFNPPFCLYPVGMFWYYFEIHFTSSFVLPSQFNQKYIIYTFGHITQPLKLSPLTTYFFHFVNSSNCVHQMSAFLSNEINIWYSNYPLIF